MIHGPHTPTTRSTIRMTVVTSASIIPILNLIPIHLHKRPAFLRQMDPYLWAPQDLVRSRHSLLLLSGGGLAVLEIPTDSCLRCPPRRFNQAIHGLRKMLVGSSWTLLRCKMQIGVSRGVLCSRVETFTVLPQSAWLRDHQESIGPFRLLLVWCIVR